MHYDTISAFIKSLRGSDPDAALYWLAKMIYAGEDPRFIFRRMLILASEDVGLADPNAVRVVNACADAFDRIGLPEGRFHLAQAALYLATAPKSHSALGFFDALSPVGGGRQGGRCGRGRVRCPGLRAAEQGEAGSEEKQGQEQGQREHRPGDENHGESAAQQHERRSNDSSQETGESSDQLHGKQDEHEEKTKNCANDQAERRDRPQHEQHQGTEFEHLCLPAPRTRPIPRRKAPEIRPEDSS